MLLLALACECVIWTYLNQRGELSFEHGITFLIFEYWNGFFYSTYYTDVSNQIFAEFRFIVVQYVESDLDDIFNMQRPDCFVCFSFLRTWTAGCFFFDEFHDGGFSVCFASHSHLGSMLFHVVRMFFVWLFDFECADPDDVFDCSLKYPTKSKESSRHLE